MALLFSVRASVLKSYTSSELSYEVMLEYLLHQLQKIVQWCCRLKLKVDIALQVDCAMLTLVGELNGWAPNWWPCIFYIKRDALQQEI